MFRQLSSQYSDNGDILSQPQKDHDEYFQKIKTLAKHKGFSNPEGFADFWSAKHRYHMRPLYASFIESEKSYNDAVDAYQYELDRLDGLSTRNDQKSLCSKCTIL